MRKGLSEIVYWRVFVLYQLLCSVQPSLSGSSNSKWILLSHLPLNQRRAANSRQAKVDDFLEYRKLSPSTPLAEIQHSLKRSSSKNVGRHSLEGPTDDVIAFYRNQTVQKVKRLLFLLCVDAGSSKTSASLWQTQIVSEINSIPKVDWENLKERKKFSKGQKLGSFIASAKSKGLDVLAAEISTVFAPIISEAKKSISELVQTLDPEKVVSDIPVIIHSTAGLRDMDPESRKKLFDAIIMVLNGALERNLSIGSPFMEESWKAINSSTSLSPHIVPTRFEITDPTTHRVVKVMRFFTTSRYCRAITGIEEAVFTFITANVALGAIQQMRVDPAKGKEKLAGILEVGGASMQVVFPVENQIQNGPLGTLDLTHESRGFLKREMFPKMNEPFYVFGTSYMNLGINRALALLQKQYCEKEKEANVDGKCFFPCLNVGWKQECIAGPPRPRQLKTQGDGLSYFEVDSAGRILIASNFLVEAGQFCNVENKLLTFMQTPRKDCERAGFRITERDKTKRSKIMGCTEIIGSGDRDKCHKAIIKHLFMNELPGNQETLSETGAAAPAEIGKFLTPKGLMFVVGGSLFFPIQQLKSWKILEPAYYRSETTGQVRRCDLTNLERAAEVLCNRKLSPRHSFLNPKASTQGATEIQLTEVTFDYCYKAVYAIALLEAVNVVKGKVQVRSRLQLLVTEKERKIH